jgi:NAD(P)-dependent dehydrogenase (short-subunit alcohol dehydrogenase family)
MKGRQEMIGKSALVTGAANGIGAATARRLAAEGLQVILADIDTAGGAALAAELGAPHVFIRLDVTLEEDWRALAAALPAGLHVAFLNAGTTGRPDFDPQSADMLPAMTPELIHRVIGVNLVGAALGLHYVHPLLRAAGGGHIICTSSTAGIDGTLSEPAYAASKAGVIALVKSSAVSLDGLGITLCGICPGSIDTRMYPANFRPGRLAAGALGSPEYLADAVMAVLREGQPGDIWMARPEDRGFWVFEPRRLPNRGRGEALPDGPRFVPCGPEYLPVTKETL